MSELIGTNELAGRLGVSATAIKKALDAGRIQAAGETDSGRRLYAWPAARDAFLNNSTVAKRSHYGSRGSPQRPKGAARVKLATSAAMDTGEAGDTVPPAGKGNSQSAYAQARALREINEAKLAKLKYERESGKLVDADEVRAEAHKLATAVIAGLYNIPDRVSDQIAGMTDGNEIQALLTQEIENAIEGLRAKYAPAG